VGNSKLPAGHDLGWYSNAMRTVWPAAHCLLGMEQKESTMDMPLAVVKLA